MVILKINSVEYVQLKGCLRRTFFAFKNRGILHNISRGLLHFSILNRESNSSPYDLVYSLQLHPKSEKRPDSSAFNTPSEME